MSGPHKEGPHSSAVAPLEVKGLCLVEVEEALCLGEGVKVQPRSRRDDCEKDQTEE